MGFLVMTPCSDLIRGYQASVETCYLQLQEKNLYETVWIPCRQNLNTDTKPAVHKDFTVKCSHYVSAVSNAYKYIYGHAVAQLVEAVRYKLEGRGFDSWWCQWNFSLT